MERFSKNEGRKVGEVCGLGGPDGAHARYNKYARTRVPTCWRIRDPEPSWGVTTETVESADTLLDTSEVTDWGVCGIGVIVGLRWSSVRLRVSLSTRVDRISSQSLHSPVGIVDAGGSALSSVRDAGGAGSRALSSARDSDGEVSNVLTSVRESVGAGSCMQSAQSSV